VATQRCTRAGSPWTESAASASLIRQERGTDSPLVERITRVQFHGDARDVTTPDGCWDLVMIRQKGEAEMLQTG
jgi:hypothetical protein